MKSPEQVVDELTYRSYAYNRSRFPETHPSRWSTVYPNAQAMEARYIREINDYAEAAIRADMAIRNAGRPEHDMSCSGVALK